MSTPVPSRDDHNRPSSWRPSPRVLLIAGIAFAIGLLLFLLLWMKDRGDGFYRAQAPVPNVEGQQFEPLPAPLPAGDAANASGMGTPEEQDDQSARIIEAPRAAPPPPIAPTAPLPPVAMAPGNDPVPIQSPAPRYPSDALRNGESGTVLLRVHVSAEGLPVAVDLIRSSRSRSLDRAASEAVKRWRFRPAQRNGESVSGVVQVPISFAADR
jgi:protein TonB